MLRYQPLTTWLCSSTKQAWEADGSRSSRRVEADGFSDLGSDLGYGGDVGWGGFDGVDGGFDGFGGFNGSEGDDGAGE